MSSLLVLLQSLALGASFLAILLFLGFGVTHFLLAPALRPWRLLVMPFTGMALLIVWDYLALYAGLNLTVATLLLLAIVIPLNLLALRQMRLGAPETGMQWGRGEWLLVGAAAVAFLAGIAPLLRYGYNTLIGENWDYEFYLILADALKAMPTAALAQAPANPLMNVVLSRHILPLPMGFSYLQSSLGVLVTLQAFDSYTVLIALLRALGVLSAFVLFRATFKMTQRAALIAAGLLALNGLLLWVTYWGYGLHLTSLALLPVALALAAHALLSRERAALPLAALALAALNVTFHPTLVAALLPLGLLGLYILITRPGRVRTASQGIILLALAALLSFPTLLHIPDFLREYYGREPLAAGLRAFVPLSDAYGLSNYTLDLIVGHTIPTPWLYDLVRRVWDIAAPLLLALTLAVSAAALARLARDRERRAVWYPFVAASLFYIALFRLPFLRSYPYGFLKSLTLGSYVLLAVFAEGISNWESVIRNDRLPITRYVSRLSLRTQFRWIALLVGLAFSALTLVTFGLTIEQYFKPLPVFFNGDDLSIRKVPEVLPPGASVFLTDRPEVGKVPMALAAYALRAYPLFGQVETGYGDLNNRAPGQVYDYALLARGEDPTARGYAAEPLWSNRTFAVYSRAPGVTFHQDVNANVRATQPLTLTIGAAGVISGTGTVPGDQVTRGVRVALAALAPQSVTLTVNGQSQTMALDAGLSIYTFPVALPAQLTIAQRDAAHATDSAPRLFVPWIEQGSPPVGGPALVSAHTLLLKCQAGAAGSLDTNCLVANPGGVTLRWEWVVRGTPKGTTEEQLLMQRSASGSPRQTVGLTARPREGLTAIQIDGQSAVLTGERRGLGDGKYRVSLDIYRGEVLLARLELYGITISQAGASWERSSAGALPLVMARP